MATVTALTADRVLSIEAATIVASVIDSSGHLILTRFDGTTIDAGVAKGPTGDAGTSGAVSVTSLESVPAGTPAGTPIFLRS